MEAHSGATNHPDLTGETPRRDSRELQAELDACKKQMAEMTGLLEVHRKAGALLEGEKTVMEMIARGGPLEAILERSCRLVEEALPGSLAIIMLLEGRKLRRGAAPSFPKYLAEVDGFEINPDVGTCSRAAARGEQIITPDIATDPHWSGFLDLAERHRLRAGWATPIFSSDAKVVGTFGLYWPEPARPTGHHFQIIDQIARLVAFAIERKRGAEALHATETLARGQAEALTASLDALARETNPDRIVEHVLRTATEHLDAQSCSVWLKNELTELMDFEFGFEEGQFKAGSEAKLAKVSPSLPVEAIHVWHELCRTGRPVVLEDIRESPEFSCRSYLVSLGVVTLLMIPMIIAGKAKGVIGVRFTRKRGFRAEELDLAQALANQAMLSIQLARLSSQSRQGAVLDERNRMARDIHDTLAQGFTSVIAQLEAARGAFSLRKTNLASSHVDRAAELARYGLQEARRSVQALRPQALEAQPLAGALEELIQQMTTGTTLRSTFTVAGELGALPSDWETHLLRIGQEALSNALRHAQATQFEGRLQGAATELRLTLRDNGRGFNPSNRGEGLGLRGIQERTQAMGGRSMIESTPGEGTTVTIVLPLNSSSGQS